MNTRCFDCGEPAVEEIGTFTDRLRDGRLITFSGITITQCPRCGELPTFPCLSKAVALIERGVNNVHWNGAEWEASMNCMYEIAKAAQLKEAEAAYEQAKGACEIFQMAKEEYVRLYIEALPPLTWTSGGTEK